MLASECDEYICTHNDGWKYVMDILVICRLSGEWVNEWESRSISLLVEYSVRKSFIQYVYQLINASGNWLVSELVSAWLIKVTNNCFCIPVPQVTSMSVISWVMESQWMSMSGFSLISARVTVVNLAGDSLSRHDIDANNGLCLNSWF